MLLRGILFAVAGFLFYVAAHIALVRKMRPRLYFLFSLQGFTALMVVFGLIVGGVGHLSWFAYLNSLSVLASLWVFYIEATYIIMRSVSIRTMVELVRSPRHALSAEDLEKLYQTEHMFDQRIASMAANGYLKQTNGHFALTVRGAALAQMFAGVRRILNIHSYG